MDKHTQYIWVWDNDDQQYSPEVIGMVSDGYITLANGDMVDVADTYPLDAVFVYDVSFVGNDKVFTLYAQTIEEAKKLARFQLSKSAGQMGMFPAEVDTVEELRLY